MAEFCSCRRKKIKPGTLRFDFLKKNSHPGWTIVVKMKLFS